jgi:OOP family OmpA-OmpF porin
MQRSSSLIIALLLSLLLYGCASTQLSPEQLNEQFPTLVQLEKDLDEAKKGGINLLAPDYFQEASNQYNEAYAAANSGQTDLANKGAQSGLESLKKANQVAENSRVVLSEVLDARRRAKASGADQYFAKEMEEYDADLVKISKLIEDNKIEKAKDRRSELQNSYSDLELKGLKKSTIADAQAAIAKAVANDAEKLAPKTLTNAREELTKAESVLEVDRTNREKANAHALLATVLANRSYNIALAITDFKKRDFTQEDILLTHQADVSLLGNAVNKTLSFDKPNNETITELAGTIKNVVDSNNEQTQRAKNLENKLSEVLATNEQNVALLKQLHAEEVANLNARYKGEITILGRTQELYAREQQETKERFDRIQNMFTKSEANVFRQRNNVLISVHGFKFPTGSAEIRPDNFGLMNKIVKAIEEFDGSRIQISGHTDSTGSPDLNKALSNDRAQSVAKFMIDVAGLSPTRIQAEGFGQEKPVASNQTADGRAKNRRVEILIVNE